MKAVIADLPSELDLVEIHTFSDWHIGDTLCNHTLIAEQIARVKDTPNAFAVCNGDLMNNATKGSVSDCYAITMPPQEQLDTLRSLLEPVRDKILLVNTGNHESRTYRQDGIDLSACIAASLGLEDKYCREGGVLFIRFGNVPSKGGRAGQNTKASFSAYITHGSGGGRKEGGKINRLADLASIVDTDIYIHSHTHTPAVMKQSFYRLNQQKETVTCVEKLFVNSSAMLSYGGYGQVASFKPSSNACPVIYLAASKAKKMWATL